jgi:GTP pyrophosphokinase
MAAADLTGRFDAAFLYAHERHGSQRRKGTGVPFIAHVIAVTALVLEHGGDEEQAIAALLHDTVEDHPREGRTSAEILERFGERVHRMVIAMTDSDPGAPDDAAKGPWHERKEAYLGHLAAASAEVLLVAAADKLHNARAVYEDYRNDGEAIWSRFAVGRDDQLWYYKSLVDTLRGAPAGAPERLVDELTRTVGSLETLIASPKADW